MFPFFPGDTIEGAVELACCIVTALTAIVSFLVTLR
jgi:hypothetical protein